MIRSHVTKSSQTSSVHFTGLCRSPSTFRMSQSERYAAWTSCQLSVFLHLRLGRSLDTVSVLHRERMTTWWLKCILTSLSVTQSQLSQRQGSAAALQTLTIKMDFVMPIKQAEPDGEQDTWGNKTPWWTHEHFSTKCSWAERWIGNWYQTMK